MTYIGRFAPSPSGPLHFGSLIAASAVICALALSQGLMAGQDRRYRSTTRTAGCCHTNFTNAGTLWSALGCEVIYQSQRHERYQAVLDELYQQGKTYHCRIVPVHKFRPLAVSIPAPVVINNIRIECCRASTCGRSLFIFPGSVIGFN